MVSAFASHPGGPGSIPPDDVEFLPPKSGAKIITEVPLAELVCKRVLRPSGSLLHPHYAAVWERKGPTGGCGALWEPLSRDPFQQEGVGGFLIASRLRLFSCCDINVVRFNIWLAFT